MLLFFHCVLIQTPHASAVLSKEEGILTVRTVYTHHFHIGFIVEGLSKDGHDKDVDEEGDEEGDCRLNEEVLVGFLYFLLVSAIDFTRLERGEKRENTLNFHLTIF